MPVKIGFVPPLSRKNKELNSWDFNKGKNICDVFRYKNF